MTRALRAIVGLVVASLGLLLCTVPASAHGDEGELAVRSAVPAVGPNDALIVRVEVDLTYENDGEHAGAATVTAVLRSADGTATPPAPVPHVSGQSKYAADLTVPTPGTWTLELTSEGPDAAATAVVEVPPPATTTAPTTTPTTSPPTTEAEPSTTEADGSTAGTSTSSTPPPKSDDGGSGGIVALVTLLLVGAGLGAFVTRIRARRNVD